MAKGRISSLSKILSGVRFATEEWIKEWASFEPQNSDYSK